MRHNHGRTHSQDAEGSDSVTSSKETHLIIALEKEFIKATLTLERVAEVAGEGGIGGGSAGKDVVTARSVLEEEESHKEEDWKKGRPHLNYKWFFLKVALINKVFRGGCCQGRPRTRGGGSSPCSSWLPV